jgi:hypothetical protein
VLLGNFGALNNPIALHNARHYTYECTSFVRRSFRCSQGFLEVCAEPVEVLE